MLMHNAKLYYPENKKNDIITKSKKDSNKMMKMNIIEDVFYHCKELKCKLFMLKTGLRKQNLAKE